MALLYLYRLCICVGVCKCVWIAKRHESILNFNQRFWNIHITGHCRFQLNTFSNVRIWRRNESVFFSKWSLITLTQLNIYKHHSALYNRFARETTIFMTANTVSFYDVSALSILSFCNEEWIDVDTHFWCVCQWSAFIRINWISREKTLRMTTFTCDISHLTFFSSVCVFSLIFQQK